MVVRRVCRAPADLCVGHLAGSQVGGCPAPLAEARAVPSEDTTKPLSTVAALIVGDAPEAVTGASPAKFCAAFRESRVPPRAHGPSSDIRRQCWLPPRTPCRRGYGTGKPAHTPCPSAAGM